MYVMFAVVCLYFDVLVCELHVFKYLYCDILCELCVFMSAIVEVLFCKLHRYMCLCV